MDIDDDILNYISNVKYFAYHLTFLEVPMKEEDVVMTVLGSVPPLLNHLITALEKCLIQ